MNLSWRSDSLLWAGFGSLLLLLLLLGLDIDGSVQQVEAQLASIRRELLLPGKPPSGTGPEVYLTMARHAAQGELAVAAVFEAARWRLLWRTGLVAVAGLGIAWLTSKRILALERGRQEHLVTITAARQQMKQLSAKLLSAQETERRRLSRELHDEVGQNLSALLVELNQAIRLAGNEDVHLRRSRLLAETTVVSVRNLALVLRPSMLDDLGLVPALNWQARELTRRTGIPVHVDASECLNELDDTYRTCLYRTVQEALANVGRHAQAAHVTVQLQQEPGGTLCLTVQDDGIGFNPRQIGLGLAGMRERIEGLGGRLRITSSPRAGTTISAVLPAPVATPTEQTA